MEIIVSGRHFTVTNELKSHVEDKLNAILSDKHLKISSVRVVLSVEKNRSQAEIVVNGKNLSFEADHDAYDMYEAIDKTVLKIEHQLSKRVDKLQDHHKKDSKPVLAEEATEEAAD
ncbi:MAG: ribosomal subunit interface protein [Lentisphaerae bacterium GWF2_52_8]|nr:MAG: ribosomal subunit interface protein [Lentisphaerae bacterium GWF2_52_8]